MLLTSTYLVSGYGIVTILSPATRSLQPALGNERMVRPDLALLKPSTVPHAVLQVFHKVAAVA